MPLTELADKATDKAKEAAAAISEKIITLKENVFGEDQQSIIDTFKDAGTDKVRSILEDIDHSSSYIHAVGYEITSVEVIMSLPPDVIMLFKI